MSNAIHVAICYNERIFFFATRHSHHFDYIKLMDEILLCNPYQKPTLQVATITTTSNKVNAISKTSFIKPNV